MPARLRFLFTLFAALLILASCEENPRNGGRIAADHNEAFVLNSADEGLFQISAGQAALTNGASARFAAYAQTMIDRYRISNQELQQYASKQNIRIPTTLSGPRQIMLDTIVSRRGIRLDTTYALRIAAAHTETIRYLESQTDSVTDPVLKEWLVAQLPLLRQYLTQAQALSDSAR